MSYKINSGKPPAFLDSWGTSGRKKSPLRLTLENMQCKGQWLLLESKKESLTAIRLAGLVGLKGKYTCRRINEKQYCFLLTEDKHNV
jgi:hypothetical protein